MALLIRICSTTNVHKALFVNNIFGESKDNVLWDTPSPPVLEPQNIYRYPIACQKEQVPHRMRYLALDDKICGVTISCDRGSNVSIHTHSIDSRHVNGFYAGSAKIRDFAYRYGLGARIVSYR
jgi:hypothetical protein